MTEETEKVERDADLKAQLIAKAEKMGVEIDKRWSAARIEEAIAKKHLEAEPSPPPAPAPEPEIAAPAVGKADDAAEIARLKAELEAKLALLDAKLAEPVKTGVPEGLQSTVAPAFTPAKAPPVAPPPQGEPTVACRVTKKGDGEIFTGRAAPDDRYRWGAVVHLPKSVAEALEARAYVEIGEPS